MKEVLINGKIFVLDDEVADYINTLEKEIKEYHESCLNIINKLEDSRKKFRDDPKWERWR